MFFQQMMRLDDDQGGGGLEPNPSLDPDDGVADMDIPTHAIGLRDGLQMLDRFDRLFEDLPVDGSQFPFFKTQLQLPCSCLRNLRRPCFLGEIVFGGQRLPSSDRSAPEAFVDAILRLFKIHLHAMLFQKGDLRLAAKPQIAYRRHDLYARQHALKHHVETYLVIPRAGAAMRDIVGSDLLNVFRHGDRLHHSFGADAERVGGILQDIAEDQVFDTALVINGGRVHAMEGGDPQFLCPCTDLFDLLRAESAGIDGERMHFQVFDLIQIDGTIGSVQPSAVC